MLADFDRDVVAIASQPFGLTGDADNSSRRHVPDYLLRLADGAVLVVDVKPAALIDKPKVAEVLSWTGRLHGAAGVALRGVVWRGHDPPDQCAFPWSGAPFGIGSTRRPCRNSAPAQPRVRPCRSRYSQPPARGSRREFTFEPRCWRCCGGRCGQHARDAGRALSDAVYERWRALPADQRPKLFAFGESLGSFGGEGAFSGDYDMANRLSGAVFTGPLKFNPRYRSFVDDRDAGSPEVEPVFGKGRIVRFTASPGQPVPPVGEPWDCTRCSTCNTPPTRSHGGALTSSCAARPG